MPERYDERLHALREEMAHARKQEAVLRELIVQRDELAAKTGELARQLQLEQEDVDRLSGGFRSIYYAIIGKKKGMLEKEQAEALAASLKYETARKELDEVQKDVDRVGWEAGRMGQLEREYRAILDKKVAAMKEFGLEAEKITRLEEQKEYIGTQILEVKEAIAAGGRVLGQIACIARSLEDAEGMGRLDLAGGGLITTAVKHMHLDDAQSGVQKLQALLRAFRTELADLSVQADVQAQTDGFTRFADWFFDGFISDWTVLSRIHDSQNSLRKTEWQAEQVMERLRQMEREMKKKQEALDGEIRALAEPV